MYNVGDKVKFLSDGGYFGFKNWKDCYGKIISTHKNNNGFNVTIFGSSLRQNVLPFYRHQIAPFDEKPKLDFRWEGNCLFLRKYQIGGYYARKLTSDFMFISKIPGTLSFDISNEDEGKQKLEEIITEWFKGCGVI